ncbi:MAG: GGDEF domain-containing protein [Polyangiaceae bacterium]|nr:GGDEF domain-containing protein [Polyangiaceae bacterium]
MMFTERGAIATKWRAQRGRIATIPSRTRFAAGGLGLAALLALVAPVVAHTKPIGIALTTFMLLAMVFVGLGLHFGNRIEALERRCSEDPMTRVGNRRRWQARLTQELERAAMSRMPLSVLMIDLDNLKHLNDAQGHRCGDRALALIGEALLATCRSRDVPARLGGDEFAVVLPRTRSLEARIAAERIRAEIARRSARLGEPFADRLTVSIGIADLGEIGEPRATSLVESADSALYVAKAAGRDRIEVFAKTQNVHPRLAST